MLILFVSKINQDDCKGGLFEVRRPSAIHIFMNLISNLVIKSFHDICFPGSVDLLLYLFLKINPEKPGKTLKVIEAA